MKRGTRLYRSIKAIFSGAARLHFSQYGEDIVLHKRFRNPSHNFYYIDVGAHHPYHLSNTVDLWCKGWGGVNVDASGAVIEKFNSDRPGDLNIHAAVVSEATRKNKSLITFFSNREIDNCATCDPDIALERGLNIKTLVPCLSLSEVIMRAHAHFTGSFGFLNIDIEGLDDEVIEDVALWPEKPLLIMIEIYCIHLSDLLKTRTYQLLIEGGYTLVERIGHTAVFERQPSLHADTNSHQ